MNPKKSYEIPKTNLPQLGRSKDYKTQLPQESLSSDHIPNSQKIFPAEPRLVNAVSTQYNILNNTKTISTVYDRNLSGVRPSFIIE
jgi:hypothetical protein